MDPKTSYLTKLSGGATKPPIPWDRISFSNTGATAPATTSTYMPTPSAKSQYVQAAAQSNPATTSNYAHGAPLPGEGTSGTQYNYVNGTAVPQGAPAATNDPQAKADAAFDEYLKSLNASPEHKAAQQYLNNLMNQQESDITAVDKHAGQTTSFAGAEKERINYDANNAISAASRALSVYENLDQNKATVGKAKLDYLAGRAKDIASAAVAEQNGLPASAKEYEYAKKQGYTGSFTQYQNEDANRKAKASGSTSTSRAETNAAQADDVATAILDFQQQMQSKGWMGANPQAYDYYRSELSKLYGASAALALDAAMRSAGIIVDRKNP